VGVLLILITLSSVNHRSVYTPFTRWDAQWYRRIAENGYGYIYHHPDGRSLRDYAFFPVYPFLERAIHSVTTMNVINSGILISVISSVIAATGIYRISHYLYGDRVAVISVALWALIPVGVVEWLAYSESLFTALAVWSLYFILRKRFLRAALLASLAGGTRPVGLAVVAAVVISLLLELRRGSSFRLLASLAIAPLGLLGYMEWVNIRLGSSSGYFSVAKGWGNTFDGGVSFFTWIIHGSVFRGLALSCAVVGLLILLWTLIRQNQPLPLLIFAGVIVFVALTTSGYFGSKPRYLLPVFPLLFPFARSISARTNRVVVLILGALGIATGIYGALWLLGSGPL